MRDKKVRKLENFEDLFRPDNLPDSEEKYKQYEIEISQLAPFENHPFKPYEGKKLDDMVESIKENGVITPIVVRPMEGDVFEILSGHNRVNALGSGMLASELSILLGNEVHPFLARILAKGCLTRLKQRGGHIYFSSTPGVREAQEKSLLDKKCSVAAQLSLEKAVAILIGKIKNPLFMSVSLQINNFMRSS
jgi:hypothetical protein